MTARICDTCGHRMTRDNADHGFGRTMVGDCLGCAECNAQAIADEAIAKAVAGDPAAAAIIAGPRVIEAPAPPRPKPDDPEEPGFVNAWIFPAQGVEPERVGWAEDAEFDRTREDGFTLERDRLGESLADLDAAAGRMRAARLALARATRRALQAFESNPVTGEARPWGKAW